MYFIQVHPDPGLMLHILLNRMKCHFTKFLCHNLEFQGCVPFSHLELQNFCDSFSRSEIVHKINVFSNNCRTKNQPFLY